jgi:hypothetical protein
MDQPFPGKGDDLFFLTRASGRRVTKAFGTTPQYGSRGDHRRFQNIRVLVQDAFHLDCEDVDPPLMIMSFFRSFSSIYPGMPIIIAVGLLYRRVTLISAWLAKSDEVD